MGISAKVAPFLAAKTGDSRTDSRPTVECDAPRTERPPRYLSPLRYPGGKAKLAHFIERLVIENGLAGGHYVEPYAGGASVALSLLFRRLASHIHINDLDPFVYAFWHCVLHRTDEFCRLVKNRRLSIAEWTRQRAVYCNPEGKSLLEKGFSTFYLNRTNRAGIISSGGMIGGRSQLGDWTLAARFNKAELVVRIERIAALRSQISLYSEDAGDLLASITQRLPEKTLVYLDPPYFVKGTRRLYANSYQHKDHERLASIIRSSTFSWLVSYDDASEIRALYDGFRMKKYELHYTARQRYAGSEIMFFSDDLRIPHVASPVSLPRIRAQARHRNETSRMKP